MVEQNKQTPHEELCNEALEHYRKISTIAMHWNSVVRDAIEYYKEHGEKKVKWKADPKITMVIDNPLNTDIRNFFRRLKRICHL